MSYSQALLFVNLQLRTTMLNRILEHLIPPVYQCHLIFMWQHIFMKDISHTKIVRDSGHKTIRMYQSSHSGRVTHICVDNLTITGSNYGLSPGRRQAIIWTNARILLIGPLGTSFSEILIAIATFSFKNMHCICRLENGGHFVSASMCLYSNLHYVYGNLLYEYMVKKNSISQHIWMDINIHYIDLGPRLRDRRSWNDLDKWKAIQDVQIKQIKYTG